MKPAIKAVALDKDGVTFDTESLIYRAFRELIVREKLPLEPALFETLVGKPPEVYLKVLGEALGQEMALDDFIAHWFALRDTIFAEEGAPFMPGADRLIEYLHAAGVPLAPVMARFMLFSLCIFKRDGFAVCRISVKPCAGCFLGFR